MYISHTGALCEDCTMLHAGIDLDDEHAIQRYVEGMDELPNEVSHNLVFGVAEHAEGCDADGCMCDHWDDRDECFICGAAQYGSWHAVVVLADGDEPTESDRLTR